MAIQVAQVMGFPFSLFLQIHMNWKDGRQEGSTQVASHEGRR